MSSDSDAAVGMERLDTEDVPVHLRAAVVAASTSKPKAKPKAATKPKPKAKGKKSAKKSVTPPSSSDTSDSSATSSSSSRSSTAESDVESASGSGDEDALAKSSSRNGSAPPPTAAKVDATRDDTSDVTTPPSSSSAASSDEDAAPPSASSSSDGLGGSSDSDAPKKTKGTSKKKPAPKAKKAAAKPKPSPKAKKATAAAAKRERPAAKKAGAKKSKGRRTESSSDSDSDTESSNSDFADGESDADKITARLPGLPDLRAPQRNHAGLQKPDGTAASLDHTMTAYCEHSEHLRNIEQSENPVVREVTEGFRQKVTVLRRTFKLPCLAGKWCGDALAEPLDHKELVHFIAAHLLLFCPGCAAASVKADLHHNSDESFLNAFKMVGRHANAMFTPMEFLIELGLTTPYKIGAPIADGDVLKEIKAYKPYKISVRLYHIIRAIDVAPEKIAAFLGTAQRHGESTTQFHTRMLSDLLPFDFDERSSPASTLGANIPCEMVTRRTDTAPSGCPSNCADAVAHARLLQLLLGDRSRETLSTFNLSIDSDGAPQVTVVVEIPVKDSRNKSNSYEPEWLSALFGFLGYPAVEADAFAACAATWRAFQLRSAVFAHPLCVTQQYNHVVVLDSVSGKTREWCVKPPRRFSALVGDAAPENDSSAEDESAPSEANNAAAAAGAAPGAANHRRKFSDISSNSSSSSSDGDSSSDDEVLVAALVREATEQGLPTTAHLEAGGAIVKATLTAPSTAAVSATGLKLPKYSLPEPMSDFPNASAVVSARFPVDFSNNDETRGETLARAMCFTPADREAVPCADAPKGIKADLKQHQRESVGWMLQREKEGAKTFVTCFTATARRMIAASRATGPGTANAALTNVHEDSSASAVETPLLGSTGRTGSTNFSFTPADGEPLLLPHDTMGFTVEPAVAPVALHACLLTGNLTMSPLDPTIDHVARCNPLLRGGILADEMGLGKTLEVLSVIAGNPCTTVRRGETKVIELPLWEKQRPAQLDLSAPERDILRTAAFRHRYHRVALAATLLVVPVSICGQWVAEAARFWPSAKVLLYHGPKRNTMTVQDFAEHDIVITTYETIGAALRAEQALLLHDTLPFPVAQAERALMAADAALKKPRKNAPPPDEDAVAAGAQLQRYRAQKKMPKAFAKGYFGEDVPFTRLHFHRIVLDECQKATSGIDDFAALGATNRWAVSGTPFPGVARFDSGVYMKFLRSKMTQAHVAGLDSIEVAKLMKHFTCRHVKSEDVMTEIALPARTVTTHSIAMTEGELKVYKALESEIQRGAERLHALRRLGNRISIVLQWIQLLRRAAVHLALVAESAVAAVSGGAVPRGDAKQREDDNFGIKTMALADATAMFAAANPPMPQQLMESLAAMAEEPPEIADCMICMDTLQAPLVLKCGHVFCRECVLMMINEAGGVQILQQAADRAAAERQENGGAAGDFALNNFLPRRLRGVAARGVNNHNHNARGFYGNRPRGHCPACRRETLHTEKIQVQLPLPRAAADALLAAEADQAEAAEALAQRSLSDGAVAVNAAVDGSRANATIELVRRVLASDPAAKFVVFSAFPAMLRRLAAALATAGLSSVLIDGATSLARRAKCLQLFQSDDDLRVCLLSSRAGNAGMTLTAANHLILLEPAMSPAVDAQSMGRVHRFGQTRPVTIHRFIGADTLEERIQRQLEVATQAGTTGTGTAVPASVEQAQLGTAALLTILGIQA